MMSLQHMRGHQKEGSEHAVGERNYDERRQQLLPDGARHGAVLRPVVRAAALPAALGLPAAARPLPAPPPPVATVPQLLLTHEHPKGYFTNRI